MFDGLADVAELSPWTYLLVAALCALDAVFPVLPSESVVVAAASLAASRSIQPWTLLAVAFVGALVGDLTSYALGRQARRRWKEPEEVEGRRGRALRWASERLDAQGDRVIITARFIPGGRTATTFASGYLRYPTARFVRADVIGAALWAANGVVLGYLGGQVSDNPLVAMAAGLTLALVVSGGLSLIQRRRGVDAPESSRIRRRSAAQADAGSTLRGGGR